MKIEIKSVFGGLIFEGDFSSIAEAVTAAVQGGKPLSSANLSSADLSSANLSSANLRSANLRSADLRSANLRSAKNSEMAVAMTRILPQGTIIGWKKLSGGVIAKLRIPEDAKRSHAFGRKCRAEFAEVLELKTEDGTVAEFGVSGYDHMFVYMVGKTVRPDKFSEEWMDECSNGIHFFITREEAVAYVL